MTEVITKHLDVWTSVLLNRSTAGRGSNGKQTAYGIKKLRELILELAVRGKLLPQNQLDEPACVLLEKIFKEKSQLSKDGNTRKQNSLSPISEEEKLFDIPNGWAFARFGDITINRDSERIPLSVEERNGRQGEYDYYGASGIIDSIDNYLFDKPLLLIGEDGANLINRSTPIAFIARGKYWVNNHAHVLDGLTEDLLLYVCLHINAISLEAYVTGTAQPKMNQAKMNNIVLAIPPLEEQKRIVAKVDELMAMCDQLEQQQTDSNAAHQTLVETLLGTLTNTTVCAGLDEGCPSTRSGRTEFEEAWQRIAKHFDTLFTTEHSINQLKQTILQLAVMGKLVAQDPNDEPASELFKRMETEKNTLIAEGKIKNIKPSSSITEEVKPFMLPTGWEWMRFNDLINPAYQISYGVLVPGSDEKDGIPFVRIADLDINNPPEKPEKSINREIDCEYERTRLEGGEILMGVVGSIGKLGIAPQSWKGANIARAICRIKVNDLVNKDYILLLLQSRFMQNNFIGDTKTLAQPTLNIGLIRLSLTPVPPFEEQHRIVAKVDELMALCDALKARIKQAQTTQIQLADAIVEQAVA